MRRRRRPRCLVLLLLLLPADPRPWGATGGGVARVHRGRAHHGGLLVGGDQSLAKLPRELVAVRRGRALRRARVLPVAAPRRYEEARLEQVAAREVARLHWGRLAAGARAEAADGGAPRQARELGHHAHLLPHEVAARGGLQAQARGPGRLPAQQPQFLLAPRAAAAEEGADDALCVGCPEGAGRLVDQGPARVVLSEALP